MGNLRKRPRSNHAALSGTIRERQQLPQETNSKDAVRAIYGRHHQWRLPMELILIIVVLVLLFGGGGGYFGRSRGYW
jgi:hypothetical protein